MILQFCLKVLVYIYRMILLCGDAVYVPHDVRILINEKHTQKYWLNQPHILHYFVLLKCTNIIYMPPHT